MSTWIGSPGDRLSIREAQSALADSVRAAARPSWIWLAGLFYPSVLLLPGIGFRAALGYGREQDFSDALGPLLPFLLPPLMLLVAGLSRLSSRRNWDECVARNGRVRLRDAMRSGKGLLWSTYGLWLCVLMLDMILLGPCFLVFRGRADERPHLLAYAVGGPLLVFCCAYAAVISVLFQLALHSLAQNQRGVISALQHGWKLAQNDPWATLRAALVDCALSVALWVFPAAVNWIGGSTGLVEVAQDFLWAITGVARALYWGRVYRALGGLTPEDGVPGLPPIPQAAGPQ